MATLRAGFQLYRITADCPAILLADYSRDDRAVMLPAGTIFSVKEDAGSVGGKVCNGIAANGKRYRVEAAVLVENSAKL